MGARVNENECGETATEVRLSAVEKRMGTLEAQQAEMLKVLYMGRGVVWTGGLIAAFASLSWVAINIWNVLKAH